VPSAGAGAGAGGNGEGSSPSSLDEQAAISKVTSPQRIIFFISLVDFLLQKYCFPQKPTKTIVQNDANIVQTP
jgi:hypothetical protein